jgi:hypothetical protein
LIYVNATDVRDNRLEILANVDFLDASAAPTWSAANANAGVGGRFG